MPIDLTVLLHGKILDEEEGQSLCRPITAIDVKRALFSTYKHKALGPDGFSSEFFTKSWNIVGNDVSNVVLEFFRSGKMLRQMNHTSISYIAKSDHSSTPADYRPIACCNVTYKIIAKILSDRLSSVLDSIVDRDQSAFVKGRCITDNIFLAQELVWHYSRKRISPRCLLKVDLKKSYDTISCPYRTWLSQYLHPMGHGVCLNNVILRLYQWVHPWIFSWQTRTVARSPHVPLSLYFVPRTFFKAYEVSHDCFGV